MVVSGRGSAGVGGMQVVVGASVVDGLEATGGVGLIGLDGRRQGARCAAVVEGGPRDGKLGKNHLEYFQA